MAPGIVGGLKNGGAPTHKIKSTYSIDRQYNGINSWIT